MRGSSRSSLVATRANLDAQLRGLDAPKATKLSADLFALANALTGSTAFAAP